MDLFTAHWGYLCTCAHIRCTHMKCSLRCALTDYDWAEGILHLSGVLSAWTTHHHFKQEGRQKGSSVVHYNQNLYIIKRSIVVWRWRRLCTWDSHTSTDAGSGMMGSTHSVQLEIVSLQVLPQNSVCQLHHSFFGGSHIDIEQIWHEAESHSTSCFHIGKWQQKVFCLTFNMQPWTTSLMNLTSRSQLSLTSAN